MGPQIIYWDSLAWYTVFKMKMYDSIALVCLCVFKKVKKANKKRNISPKTIIIKQRTSGETQQLRATINLPEYLSSTSSSHIRRLTST